MRPLPSLLPWTSLLLSFLACNPSLQPEDLSASPGDDAAPDAALSWGDDAGSGGEDADATTAPAWETSAPVAEADAAAPEATPVEGPPPGACAHDLGPGDLVVDELMIESVAGAGDDGEWLEIANTAGCTVNLRGLHGECPVGAKVHTFDVTDERLDPRRRHVRRRRFARPRRQP